MACCAGGGNFALKLQTLEESSPLGVYLSFDELDKLARSCTISPIKQDQPLAESPFYIVLKGQVQVSTKTGKVLVSKVAGTFFTRRAGLVKREDSRASKAWSGGGSPISKGSKKSYSESRDTDEEILADDVPTTSIVGQLDGSVLWITGEKLDSFMAQLSEHSRDAVGAILRTNIGTQLSQVPFIQEAVLAPADLRSLGELCSYRTVAENTVIFKQGDVAEEFYIILKGLVEVTIDAKQVTGQGDAGESVAAGKRHVGESFGVAALVYNAATRKYSVRAMERTLLLVISKDNFSKFLAHKPSLEDTLMASTKRFLLQRYKAMRVPIFCDVTPEQLEEAARLAKFAHFDAASVIYKQGDPPSAFYVVLHGEVSMSTSNDVSAATVVPDSYRPEVRMVTGNRPAESEQTGLVNMLTKPSNRRLGVGQHFGEVGVLLPQTPCIATVTAVSQCTTLLLSADDFMELFGRDRKMIAEMTIRLLQQGCPLQSVLNYPQARTIFEAHIDKEYAQESIRFYDAAKDYLSRLPGGRVRRKLRAAGAPAAAAAAAPAEAEGEELDEGGARAEMRKLVDEYIKEGSPQQVNIPGGLQKKISGFDAGVPLLDPSGGRQENKQGLVPLLKQAKREIYELMARDNFPRFKLSEPWTRLLGDIGVYDEGFLGQVADADLKALTAAESDILNDIGPDLSA